MVNGLAAGSMGRRGRRNFAVASAKLGPAASYGVTFDASAAVPRTFVGQAPRAYAYYNDAQKAWRPPLSVKIVPAN